MIRISGIIEESYTDGEGIRCTIFTQGCAHNCYKCQNPETHEFGIGPFLDNNKILDYLKSNPLLNGVTFSGGDPMYQASECKELAYRIKHETSLNIWCYTGFTFEEVLKSESMLEFLKYIDILVDGLYVDAERCLACRFKGSRNQRIIDVKESLKTGEVVEYIKE
jgi:anaerobic ribonucleoside-triphosphate reductase activating protein